MTETAPPMPSASGQSQRQYVNFRFLRLDPVFRRLPLAHRRKGAKEFLNVYAKHAKRMMVFSYSTIGIRADCELLLWRISYRLEDFQEMSSDIFATGLGKYLTPSYSYLAMTSRSTYVKEHTHEGGDAGIASQLRSSSPERSAGGHASRLEIVPAQSKYLFVYPFTKTPDWYLLPFEERQKMMDAHFAYGHKYPSVKVNTTYSFGLDDQEFVVAFETNRPADFLDLVMEMRATTVRKYTLKDTPIFTCVKEDIGAIIKLLDAGARA